MFPSFNPIESSTPDAVKRQRAIAEALIGRSATPAANWSHGLADVAAAISGTVLNNRSAEAEQAGRATVAEALAGLGPESSFSDLSAAVANPWITDSPGASSIISALIGRNLDASDPMNQLRLQQAQLDYNQDMAGESTKPETYFGNGIPIRNPDGSISYGQFGNQGGFNVPELPEGATFLTPVQQLNTGTEFTGRDKFGAPAGIAAPINNMGAAQDTAVGKGLGEQSLSAIDAGRNAAANNAKLSVLEQTLANAPQGAQGGLTQLAGAVGIDLGGLTDIQASQAIINQLVPLQRAPGSGTMSDADLALFKASLPAIINQPGANERIIQTAKALNDYTIAHAEIEQKLMSGQIDQATALQMKQAIPNPIPRPGASSSAKPSTEVIDWTDL